MGGAAAGPGLVDRAAGWVDEPVLAAAYVVHGHATPRLVNGVAIGLVVSAPVAVLVPGSWGTVVGLLVVAVVAVLVSLVWRLVADAVTGVRLGWRGVGVLVVTESGYAVRTRAGVVATFAADALVTVARPNVLVAALTFERVGDRPARLDVSLGGQDDHQRPEQAAAVAVLESRARDPWRRWS